MEQHIIYIVYNPIKSLSIYHKRKGPRVFNFYDMIFSRFGTITPPGTV